MWRHKIQNAPCFHQLAMRYCKGGLKNSTDSARTAYSRHKRAATTVQTFVRGLKSGRGFSPVRDRNARGSRETFPIFGSSPSSSYSRILRPSQK